MSYSVLSVGINKYGSASASLRGCIQDVENFSKAIEQRRFPLVYQQHLLDKQATAYRMRHALAEVTQQGAEKIIVQVSSHGSRIGDRNRDERFSKYDQCLVPVDYSRNGMIVDDELGGFADLVPNEVTLIYWLDSCYSGGSSRGLGLGLRSMAKRAFAVPSSRALPPHLVTEKVILATRAAGNQRPVTTITNLRADFTTFSNVQSSHLYVTYTDERHVLIAMARSSETAADALVEGKWQGAGTAATLWAWQQLGNRANYLEVAEQANIWLERNGYAQRVVIEGSVRNLNRPFLT